MQKRYKRSVLFSAIAKKRLSAFTLIELLIVVAIIGILATVVILNVQGAQAKARYAKALDDMTTIVRAMKTYEADTGKKAPDDTGTGALPTGVENYLPKWPTPPCSGDWGYSWNNWSRETSQGDTAYYQTLGDTIRVTLRKNSVPNPGEHDYIAKFFYCFQYDPAYTTGNPPYCLGGPSTSYSNLTNVGGKDLTTMTEKKITCKE